MHWNDVFATASTNLTKSDIHVPTAMRYLSDLVNTVEIKTNILKYEKYCSAFWLS